MPMTSWPVAREDILRPLGFVKAATSTNIANDNLIISTDLAEEFTDDDFFKGWWMELLDDADGGTTNNFKGEVRRITAYTASTGQLTVSGAAWGGTQDESVNFILSRFSPKRVKEYFNRASRIPEVAHTAAILRDVQVLVTGQQQHRFTLPTTINSKPIRVWLGNRVIASSLSENEVTDPGFEDWTNSTTPVSWTITGTDATVTQEQQTTSPSNYNVLEEDNSARVLSASSGATTLLQTVTPSVSTEGVEANFSIWVYCRTASRVSARVGSTDGTAHTGTGWERLTATEVLGSTDTTVSVGISVSAGTAIICYVDEALLILGQSEPIEDVWTPLLNWRWLAPNDGGSNGGLLEFPYDLPEKRRLRVVARDFLSAITFTEGSSSTAETETIEVDGPRLQPIYEKVRELLCQEAKMVGSAGERNYWAAMERDFRRDFNEAISGAVLTGFPNPQVHPPQWGL